MARFIKIEEPPRRAAAAKSFALWQLGFRPFYLLASGFAAISVALWALQFAGWLKGGYLSGPIWHAHEMLFGFAAAVVVGFLLTAGRNWSNRPTLTGVPLMALAGLWVAGRVLVLTRWGWAAAIVNVAFPLAAAIALAVPFLAARNRRNYFFVGLLVLLALAEACVHLSELRVLPLSGWAGVQLGLDLLLFIMAVMGGRVIPMFTNNAVPGSRATRRPWLEKAALGSVLALIVADVLHLQGQALAWLAACCAATQLARWWLWQPYRTWRVPLVWVLHLAYFWIPVHLALRSLAASGVVSPSVAVHALTAGGIGGLVIGMITRTARGHTGRPLRADRVDVACYLLVAGSAAVRVGMPLLAPTLTIDAVLMSGALWSAGFALYALRYWPVLTRARADGRPG